MRELVWEWLLADGSTVRATLDRKRREESVWVGRRLVSRAPTGSKPGGHSISSSIYREVDVRVTFAAEDEECTLRRGDDVVAPRTWPAKKRRDPLTGVPLPIALGMMGFLTVAFVVAHLLSSGTSTQHVDRLAGSNIEPSYVDLDQPLPPTPPASTGRVLRSRPVRSLPNAPPIVIAPPPAPVAFARPTPRVPTFSPPPPPRTFVSRPRPSPAGFTVDVVCDAQGACQGVRPVRLSMR